MKTCSRCKERKPTADFHKSSRHRQGCQPWCKMCAAEYQRTLPEETSKRYHRAWYGKNRESEAFKQRARKYGITREQFRDLQNEQDGKCAACGDELREGHWQHIDHCHESGRVRGILCRYCNTALGFFREDPDKLLALAEYAEACRAD